MKRVLVIIHTPVYGGPHNQVLRLGEPLRRHGWETLAVLPTEEGDGAERLREAGAPVHTIELHRLRKTLDPRTHAEFLFGFPREVRTLRTLIRDHSIDLVQICGVMHPHGAIAARLEGVPVVWQLLSTFAPMPVRRFFMPIVTRFADAIMSTGMRVARAHPGATDFDERLVPFFPPVDTEVFRPDPDRRDAARKELGIPADGVLVGTIGNFNWQKGHEFLVRAAGRICRERDDVYVRILGVRTPTQEQYYEREVRREAERLGLLAEDRLRFVEPGSRVAELLPAFDLFALTSRAEGIPTVLLEALSCGVPVVAVDVGSVGEAVEDGVTGRVLESNRPTLVSAAVLELLSDGRRRREMAGAAREAAVRRFDVSTCALRHAEAYRLALEHHSGNRSPAAATMTS